MSFHDEVDHAEHQAVDAAVAAERDAEGRYPADTVRVRWTITGATIDRTDTVSLRHGRSRGRADDDTICRALSIRVLGDLWYALHGHVLLLDVTPVHEAASAAACEAFGVGCGGTVAGDTCGTCGAVVR